MNYRKAKNGFQRDQGRDWVARGFTARKKMIGQERVSCADIEIV